MDIFCGLDVVSPPRVQGLQDWFPGRVLGDSVKWFGGGA